MASLGAQISNVREKFELLTFQSESLNVPKVQVQSPRTMLRLPKKVWNSLGMSGVGG